MTHNALRTVGLLTMLGLPCMSFAASQSFTDVPAQSPQYAAVEYLKEQGVLSGYSDPSTSSGQAPSFVFKPQQIVNRAEMIKIIVTNKVGSGATSADPTALFQDVKADAWYAPYVSRAVELNLIDDPSMQATFRPEHPVTRAETLKMIFASYAIDVQGNYGEITYPLASDAISPLDWFYPYVRFGLTSSSIQTTENRLLPQQEMTRGDTAELLYRFLLYRDGKQTQTLLSATENDVLSALQLIGGGVTDTARQAAARAILSARGALASRPDDMTAKAAVKTAEGTMALVEAAAAIEAGDSQTAVNQASIAWHLGGKALEFSSSLKALDLQLQTAATKMADRARLNE